MLETAQSSKLPAAKPAHFTAPFPQMSEASVRDDIMPPSLPFSHGDMYAAAGMVPVCSGPPMNDYFAYPTYPEYAQPDGLSPHFYSGDAGQHSATGFYGIPMARHGEVHHPIELNPFSNTSQSLSSRSHSDSDLQMPGKRRKSNGMEAASRCESSFSEGALASSHNMSNHYNGGFDCNEYFGSTDEDGHTFDLVHSGAFLDAENLFPT